MISKLGYHNFMHAFTHFIRHSVSPFILVLHLISCEKLSML